MTHSGDHIDGAGAVTLNPGSETSERENLLERIFAHAPDAVFLARMDGQILDANLAASVMLGYSKQELLSMFPWDFVTSASREEILSQMSGLTLAQPFSMERTYRKKSGEIRGIDLRLTRFNWPGGDLVIASCRDVTEKRQLEEKLQRSEKNLAEGQRLSKTGSWILDYETGVTEWSVETCRIFGFPDPPPSPHYNEFIARVRPEDQEAVNQALRESFETGQPRPLRYVFVLPDGTQKNIETVAEMRAEIGSSRKLIGTVMDVTERVEAERFRRGQLEALKSTLIALAKESDPDKALEHVLRTMVAQLGGKSANIWERTSEDNLDLTGNFDDNHYTSASKPNGVAPKVSIRSRNHPVWSEVLRTGNDCVIGKIDHDPPLVRLASREGSPWYPWHGDPPVDPIIPRNAVSSAAGGVVATVMVPMVIGAKVEGMIGIHFGQRRDLGKEEIQLMSLLANLIMLTIQLVRLSRKSRESAVLAERNRFARDIHDTLAQGFTGVIMQLEAADGAAARGDLSGVSQRIEQANVLARSSLGEARRSVRALRPNSLRKGTLGMALESLLKSMTDGTELQAEFRLVGEERIIPPTQEEELLRIAQEALTNTLKHAKARHFDVTLTLQPEAIQLQLVDDGLGFDPDEDHEGYGLVGMKERVTQLNGQFILRTKAELGSEILVILQNDDKPSTERADE
jgi:PAS domain S-box-containing protein